MTLREIFDTLVGFGSLGLYFILFVYLHSVFLPVHPEGECLEIFSEDQLVSLDLLRSNEDSVLSMKEQTLRTFEVLGVFR